MTSATRRMLAEGQSPWFDYISRDLLDSGELARMVRDEEITGVTSNPTIFEKAVSSSDRYTASINQAAADGVTDPYEGFVRLAAADIRRACETLLPVHERTRGADGFVSLEIPPGLERDIHATVAEARRLAALVGQPNVMIKAPGTPEGVAALEELIFAGINVNQTLLFDTAVYEQSASAYIRGLERRAEAGLPVDRPASVASFFVSRVDTAVDPLLPDDSPLRGKAAVANARDAYRRFQAIFAGPRWEKLRDAGARVQRPLWASTGTKNPAYSDVLYVEELVARDTVNTMPEATLRAMLDHGRIVPMGIESIEAAPRTLEALAAEGIEMQTITNQLLADGLAAFERDFHRLLDRIGQALTAAPVAGT